MLVALPSFQVTTTVCGWPASESTNDPIKVAVPFSKTAVGFSATLDGAVLLIEYEPFTGVTVKFARSSPLVIGTIVVVPGLGPTGAGLFTQLRPPINAPVTAHAEGECVPPSKMTEPLPAVAVTNALFI